MRWPGSSADPNAASSAYTDAAVRLLAANAKEGSRSDPKSLKSERSTLLSASDDPVVVMARGAGCPDDEVESFALCVGVERSLERQRIIESVARDGVGVVRLGMLDQLASDSHRGAATVGPDSRLVRARLVSVGPTGPFGSRQVMVHPTVMWGLAGDGRPDPDLPVGTRLVERPTDRGVDGREHTSMLVTGVDPTRRRTLLMTGLAGGSVLVVRNPSERRQWEAAVREATLARAALLIELTGSLDAEGAAVLDEADHLVLGVSTTAGVDPEILPRRNWVEFSAPDPQASSAEVAAVLGDGIVHPLSADQLRRVHATMPLVDRDVTRAVRRLADHRLFELGNRTEPRRGWDDLIVNDDVMTELRELTARYRFAAEVRAKPVVGRHVSPGVLAVFAGPSGTGKTLAAEVIAGELGLELVKIDLSTVVSKYIGETEKNLEEVFDAASVGGALVLFDEGDAIFGKRSEVSDARDRYANIEVAYLLQRVETFEGFVIISTNFAGNVDSAFQRRLQAMVEFPLPDVGARRRLWEMHLPESLCDGSVSLDELAAVNLAGGSIRNVAVAAAFMATERDELISRDMLRVGFEREYRKLGRLSQGLLP
jgi:SpoVK/Ycf46/Vps4 family AAA+-type ATPase